MGIITDFETIEEEVLCYLDEMFLFLDSPSKFLNLTVAPTLCCDFKCTYCYESGIDKKFNLNKDQYEKNFSFLEDYISKNRIEELQLIIIGGEPLIVPFETYEYLTRKILNLNLRFSSEIVTNGYTYTEQVKYIFKLLRVDKIQITLDGSEEMHNRVRLHKNGVKTFQKIIDNIGSILKDFNNIKMIIRFNCSKDNIIGLDELIEYLSIRFSKDINRIYLNFGMLMEGSSDSVNQIVKEWMD